MSRFFPQAAYAEDQLYPHTILTAHVLYRGFQSGALIGPVLSLPRHIFFSKSATPAQNTKASSVLLRSAGRGGLVGTGLWTVGLVQRMYGKEEIEWSDRSWRILGNKGQVETDDFSLVGAAVGAGLVGLKRGSLVQVVGGAGLGSLMGVGAYMVWRYGVNGGNFES